MRNYVSTKIARWGVATLSVIAGVIAVLGFMDYPTYCDIVPRLCYAEDDPRMVFVPSGPFQMGSDDHKENEKPQHEVRLDSFFIGQTEVTNAQYKLCVDARVCPEPDVTKNISFTTASDYPVVGVTWHDASLYCEWAGGRLPTEAEWERAAQPLEGKSFISGNIKNEASAEPCDSTDNVTVGSFTKESSEVGALDMIGNVWEWVSDWYADDYYSNSPVVNPKGPATGEEKVLRGGSACTTIALARLTYRHTLPYTITDSNVGFRCVVEETR